MITLDSDVFCIGILNLPSASQPFDANIVLEFLVGSRGSDGIRGCEKQKKNLARAFVLRLSTGRRVGHNEPN